MTTSANNPWGISFMAMFHMSGDSHLFLDAPGPGRLPLYEAKLIHQFDHRWATYTPDGDSRNMTLEEKQDPHSSATPRYWVDQREVWLRVSRLPEAQRKALRDDKPGADVPTQTMQATQTAQGSFDFSDNHCPPSTPQPIAHEAQTEHLLKASCPKWLMGWRDICRATDERTVIATVIATVMPLAGVGNNLPLMLFAESKNPVIFAALLGNLSALVLDFVARHKTGGTHMNYFIFKQLPVLPPDHYTEADLAFIVPRVLELTYTAHDLSGWAQDLGYNGPPFAFDPDRRAVLRGELDAYYARLYGLTRDELRYILDPADVMGADYPSETFRVLKNGELREFGEYRTQRLVLAAWDRLGRE